MIIVSDLIRQTTESYSFIHTTQYCIFTKRTPVRFITLGTAKGYRSSIFENIFPI
jgi:hypothetical protein